MTFLIDTNICIAILKGSDRKLLETLKTFAPSDFFLSSVVKAELLYGARKSQRVSENLALLTQFFSQFESLPFDDKSAEFYGTLRTLLEKNGTPIGANDLFIASLAIAHDLTVLTRNRSEFSRVPGLRVETW